MGTKIKELHEVMGVQMRKFKTLILLLSIKYTNAEAPTKRGGGIGRFAPKHHLLSRGNNQRGENIIIAPDTTTTATATATATAISVKDNHNAIGIASYRTEYDDGVKQENLVPHKANEFQFQRFQSPSSIQNALQWKHGNKKEKKRKKTKPSKSDRGGNTDSSSNNNFTLFQGKDGRKGYISSTKLGGDWVLAQSKQIAKETTAKEVLRAYLNGSLQEQWNEREVLKCQFTCRDIQDGCVDDDIPSSLSITHPIQNERHHKNVLPKFFSKRSRRSFLPSTNKDNTMNTGKFYRQDLVLRSQRVITSETGIMKYTQTITIDQIGNDKYCVLVRLDDDTNNKVTTANDGNHHQQQVSTKCKPFDSLLVHVGLEQNGNDVKIYADGIMKVNRKVVPNLIVFDASGIAGSMAGKGTLWLGAHFEQESTK